MSRLVFFTIAAAFCGFVSAAEARAGEPVALRAELAAEGENVRLSDLFEPVDPARDAVIARAPRPGRITSFETAWLARTAAAHELEWANARGLKRVSVRRASQSVPAATLSALIAEELAMAEGGEWAVAVAGPQELHTPTGPALDPVVVSVQRDAMSRRFTAEISLSDALDPVRLTGRAERAVALPALARAIAKGEILTAADLSWTRVPASRAPSNAITDVSAIAGMAAKRALRPGAVLKSYDLIRPAAIHKGEIVTIIYEHGALTLTARGRALADTPAGEVARFTNLQSGRVIEALAEAPGRARVRPVVIGGPS
ncbi:MAG: flagellar basal body P-ring formation chaperone FlgA [Caulobacterales bacterium]|nr:flagellar basal body P-ring formation chaperone FlgA [Caulobacterales bacterium]